MKQIRAVFTFTLLSLGTFFIRPASNAFAYVMTPPEACTSIDFRESFPLKMRDQGDLSWCYAHAAADYLQYTYQVPEQISAADIAINYSQSKLSRFITFFNHLVNARSRGKPPQTGFIVEAVRMITPQGYCPETVLPSDHWTKVDTATQTRTSIGLLDAIVNTYDLQKKIQNGTISTAASLPWFLEFNHIGQNEFFDLLKNSSQNHLLEKIRNTVCSESRKPFPSIPIASHFALKGKRFFQKMNASFDEGMPITIDFFNGVFKDYDHSRSHLGSLHTVLMYGRKFDSASGECTYLMKNSHGASCDQYDPKIKCEAGYLWFPESKIYEVMTSRLILKRL